ncbi:MAG: hypothetical protein ACLUHK_06445 [Eubacteriales bacterium]
MNKTKAQLGYVADDPWEESKTLRKSDVCGKNAVSPVQLLQLTDVKQEVNGLLDEEYEPNDFMR